MGLAGTIRTEGAKSGDQEWLRGTYKGWRDAKTGDQIARRGIYMDGEMRMTALNGDEQQYSPLPWLLRPDDVAELCQVSTKTVLRAIRAGRLRAYRLGARAAYRIRPDDVEAWLQSCPVRGRTRQPVEEAVLPPQPRERGRLTLDGEVSGE